MKLFRLIPFLAAILPGCTDAVPRYADALEPEDALDAFRLREGFRIDLFAAEPHVADPVELVFDADGRAFVVEMHDYPDKPAPGQGRSRILRLDDRDGDGRIDTHTVFADSLSEATSALPWRDGLLVTSAPDILWLRDTDGDGRADTREVLFTGFFEHNSEAQITNLRFAVDNWIYAANFGQGGQIRFTRRPDAPPLQVSGGDFRFRLDRDQFEAAAGPTQFGQAIDAWGHRFATQNTLHIRQLVLPRRYRHAHLPPFDNALDINAHGTAMGQLTDPPYWRAERTARRQKLYDEQGQGRVEHAAGHFTGASGGTVYLGDAFPDAYVGNYFIGDVAGNLVHRDVLRPVDDSPTFAAYRAEDEHDREFLVSTDPWFRPAHFAVGPDGALYVVDMYRQHIETPLSIPEDLKADMDFYAGDDRGRIYRILPAGVPSAPAPSPTLGTASTDELVTTLAHPNQWWRLTAQRLLVERQDTSTVSALHRLAATHARPEARLHAYYTLEALDALTSGDVETLLGDPHPGLREHGACLAERFPELLPALAQLADDPAPHVAFQAALSLGTFDDPRVPRALTRTARRYGHDRWMQRAILTAASVPAPTFLDALAEAGFFAAPDSLHARLLHDLAYVAAHRARDGEADAFLLRLARTPALDAEPWRSAARNGFTRARDAREEPLALSDAAEAVLKGLGR